MIMDAGRNTEGNSGLGIDSHASPTPFTLESSWSGLETLGQLSCESGIPSLSESSDVSARLCKPPAAMAE